MESARLVNAFDTWHIFSSHHLLDLGQCCTSHNLRLKVYQTDKVRLVASPILIRNGTCVFFNFSGPGFPAAEAKSDGTVVGVTEKRNGVTLTGRKEVGYRI